MLYFPIFLAPPDCLLWTSLLTSTPNIGSIVLSSFRLTRKSLSQRFMSTQGQQSSKLRLDLIGQRIAYLIT